VYFDKAIPSCARKYTDFSATVIALSSLLQTLLTEVERLDLSFGAMMVFWWSALAACLVSDDVLKLSQPAVIILFAPVQC
jgi:ribose/xylose/arabinose/galactoside ABC-type transport system permease subunit